jgi:hypothetical protein
VQAALRTLQHLDVAVQVRQCQQCGAGHVVVPGGLLLQARHVLAAQERDDGLVVLFRGRILRQDRVQHADMGQVQAHVAEASQGQGTKRQFLDFGVRFQPGVAVNLGADLERFARRMQAGWAGMQHGAGVAQAGHGSAVQQVGVDARHLRRHVGAQAQHAAGDLVHQFECAQVGIRAGARQQGLDVLQHRRHHELVAVQPEVIQHQAAQLLDLACFGRQDVGNIFRQKPIRHGWCY